MSNLNRKNNLAKAAWEIGNSSMLACLKNFKHGHHNGILLLYSYLKQSKSHHSVSVASISANLSYFHTVLQTIVFKHLVMFSTVKYTTIVHGPSHSATSRAGTFFDIFFSKRIIEKFPESS